MTELSIAITVPSTSEHSQFAVELAKAASKKGHKVSVFLLGDAVNTAWSGGCVEGINPGQELSQLAIEEKLSLLICTSCVRARGIQANALREGSTPTGLHILAQKMQDSKAMLVLTQ